jgi:hypothetical protein
MPLPSEFPSARPAKLGKKVRSLQMRPTLGIPRVRIDSIDVKPAAAAWALGEWHGDHSSKLFLGRHDFEKMNEASPHTI